MYDPIMRVLTVLEILQAKEHVSGAELAERLEVSSRTVQRYIARLQDLCIPVEASRGVGGSYRLKPGFRLPPLMFTDEEAFALTLGLRALRHLGLAAFAPATEGSASKLGRVLPDPVNESMRTVAEVVALEPGPWTVSTSADSLKRVAIAVRARRRMRCEYKSHSGDHSQRLLEPYGVLHTDGRWYVVGHCLLRQELRTFRLDRMSGLEQCSEQFTRPADFDVRTYFQTHMPFFQSVYRIEVWLDLPLNEVEARFTPGRVVLTEENGGTVMSCGRERLEMLAAMLLSFGCRIVVRQPPELLDVFSSLATLASAAAQSQSRI